MGESKNFDHEHPLLLLLSEDQLTTNPSTGVSAECSRCGEKMSAPCFSCAEDCRFYLHKAIHSISFGQRVVVNSVVEEEDDEEEEMSSGLILVDLSLGKLMTSLRSYYIMRGLTKV